MSWFMSTRWIDTKENNLDKAIENILVNNEQLTNDSSGITYANLVKNKILENNKLVNIEGIRINYNVVEFTLDVISPGLEPLQARTQPINGLIIVYFDGNSVNYFINRNSDAQRILRKILNYTGRGEIVLNNLTFNTDIFMWLIQKVYNEQSTFLYTDSDKNEEEITINGIIGVRGETVGENKLSAHGDTVLNLVSTLSFILESNNLMQLVLRIEHGVHENIEIRLNDTGVVSIDDKAYSGIYEDDSQIDEYQLKAELLLLTYIIILPHLRQIYHLEKEDELWNVDKKGDFFDSVQTRLVTRLQNRKQEVIVEQQKLGV